MIQKFLAIFFTTLFIIFCMPQSSFGFGVADSLNTPLTGVACPMGYDGPTMSGDSSTETWPTMPCSAVPALVLGACGCKNGVVNVDPSNSICVNAVNSYGLKK